MEPESRHWVSLARASGERVRRIYRGGPDGAARPRQLRAIARWLLLVGCAGLWVALFFLRQPADGLGTDFYPLYRAGRALLAGENPYGPALTAELVRDWHVPYAAAGFAYPLPAVVGVWPIVLLPLPLAILVWLVAGTLGSAAAIRLRPDWRSYLLLP